MKFDKVSLGPTLNDTGTRKFETLKSKMADGHYCLFKF